MDSASGDGVVDRDSSIVLLNLLQICDSSFPIGGFTHSGGLESSWRRGAVPDLEALRLFLKTTILATCSQQVPYMKTAHLTASTAAEKALGSNTDTEESVGDLEAEVCKILEVDNLLSVSMNNHVAKRASTQQGKSLLSLALEMLPRRQRPLLSRLLDAKNRGVFEGNLAVVFGVLCASLHIGLGESLNAFTFSTLRNSVAAAVRLGRAGPVQAQILQRELLPFCCKMVSRYQDTECGDDHQSDPVLDVLQGAQDRLFTKMFYS
ncbi:urease accessory protein F [Galendromus occidentalis]|uniref:Urease accessory protein F n=1 Tax=Galendromus occidentalis TaxID=34638 RepID=A0AAJ6QNF0_9ACAR|nr:urease accessory protein F [Galendromus occidentalis]